MDMIKSNKEKYYFSYTVGKYYVENVFIIIYICLEKNRQSN